MESNEVPILDRQQLSDRFTVAGMSLGNALGDISDYMIKQSLEWHVSPEAKLFEDAEDKVGGLIGKIREIQKALDVYKSSDAIDDVIAEEKLDAVVGGVPTTITLQIGRPTVDADGIGSCPIAAWGFGGRRPDIHGEGTLQALAMAVLSLGWEIESSVQFGHLKLALAEHEHDDEELTGLEYIRAMFGLKRYHGNSEGSMTEITP